MPTERDPLQHRHIPWDAALGLQRLDGDQDLMTDVVNLMVSTMQERRVSMEWAAAQGRHLELRQHTHAMLPSLKVLGFDNEARIFEAFETAAVMADTAACQRLTPEVQAIWSGIIQALSAHHHPGVKA